VTKQHRDLRHVVFLGEIPDLRTIVETPGGLDIGAGVTYAALRPLFTRHWPSFGALLGRLGSVQIRNAGTLGGNIANGSPIGDGMPALMALDATLVLNRGGARRTLPIADYFLAYRQTALQPGEFLERVRIPLDPTLRFATWKVSKRHDQDISAVAAGLAVRLGPGGVVTLARLAYGGMAGVPKRAAAAEAALVGRPWTPDSVTAARAALALDFSPLGDMRASAGYRALVAGNLLIRFHLETTGQAAPAQEGAHG
jgi:xanthine dehydrogenase small subunit